MKFRSNSAGYISGVRFYKGPQNVGVHTGRLWSSGGTLLASVEFEKETESGWQSARFPDPVLIEADRTYVVSYHAPYGRFSRTEGGFRRSILQSGPLQALKDGEDGPNGLYRYGAGFPTHSDAGSNFWVEPIFEYEPPTASAIKESHAAGDQATPTAQTLSCGSTALHAGDEFECQLRLVSSPLVDGLSLVIRSDSSYVRLPAKIVLRSNQQVVTFRGTVDEAAPLSAILITAGDGDLSISEQIMVAPALAPGLSAPGEQHIRPGEPLQFAVTPQGEAGVPVQVHATQLPDGAEFVQSENRFKWIPTEEQVRDKEYLLEFNTMSPEGERSTAGTKVRVDSGRPVITGPSQVVCSPGAMATLNGRWLSQKREEYSDPHGLSTELGGVKLVLDSVASGATPLHLVFVSQTQVDFLCPSEASGEMKLVLETEKGATIPHSVKFVETSPTLLTRRESGESHALITHARTGRLVMHRDHRGLGEPAQPNDEVVLWATGLGSIDQGSATLTVKIGDILAEVVKVSRALEAAGIHEIHVRIPGTVTPGAAIPVRLEIYTQSNVPLTSNTATVVVEPVSP